MKLVLLLFPTQASLMASDDKPDDTAIYRVLMNHEEQYSLWPDDLTIPDGWKDAGKRGTRAECLAYVSEVWTDMRPLSLRKAMAAQSS